jgi:hypothetical protein
MSRDDLERVPKPRKLCHAKGMADRKPTNGRVSTLTQTVRTSGSRARRGIGARVRPIVVNVTRRRPSAACQRTDTRIPCAILRHGASLHEREREETDPRSRRCTRECSFYLNSASRKRCVASGGLVTRVGQPDRLKHRLSLCGAAATHAGPAARQCLGHDLAHTAAPPGGRDDAPTLRSAGIAGPARRVAGRGCPPKGDPWCPMPRMCNRQ